MSEIEEDFRTCDSAEFPDAPSSSRDPAVGFFVYMRQQFFFGKKCQSKAQLAERTVVITGGNTGIGKETALDLAARGAKVIIACRDTDKGKNAKDDICKKVSSANVDVRHLDLASLASVRKFAEEILNSEPYIHILINNAGIAGCPKSLTEDGFEMQFGVNHLGHFLLTNLLLDRIKASAPARIVNVASLAHIFGKIDFDDLNLDNNYVPLLAYCRSKLANILYTRELAKRLKGTGVTTYCLHPGAVHTGLGRYLGSSMSKLIGRIYHGFSKVFFLTPKVGAQTTIYCAVEESLAAESGLYYCDCTLIQPNARARDDELAKKLWEVSESLVSTPEGKF